MGTVERIEALRREGELLATAAHEAGMCAPVPTCPGWTIRDLLWHTGTVHRWARTIVEESRQHAPSSSEIDKIAGPIPAPELMVEWYRESHSQLLRCLQSAEVNLECWHFLTATSPLEFWIRRQAHETAIHRVDVESARGDEISPVGEAFAVDGIDELLSGFHARSRSRVRSPTPKVLRLHPTDESMPASDWFVHISQEPVRTTRTLDGRFDCTLSGPVELLYLTLWNRCRVDDLSVTGDSDIAKMWQELSPVTW